MLKLATILDNPGEPLASTQYRDPKVLRDLGYNGVVIYPTTALSGVIRHMPVDDPEMNRWIEEQYAALRKACEEALHQEMSVWLTFDAPSLARHMVEQNMTCLRQSTVLCPASKELLNACTRSLNAMMHDFPHIDGIVLRLGDNDAHRLVHLLGNDIYAPQCARCNAMGRVDRLEQWITHFYDLVIGKMGKRMIVRGWNLRPGGMHDSPDVCQRLVDRLPRDERLILSFKFTHTDFWRYQHWNPSSLVCGDRPILYELECQREFEGKGAVINYQPPLWHDGMPESSDRPKGLYDYASQVNLAGLWAWVRGGGWGGPFVTNEMWIDANVTAVPILADNPKTSLHDLAEHWITERLGCESPQVVQRLKQILLDSPQAVLEGFYIGPAALAKDDPWYPCGNFMQDDVIDAEAGWRLIQSLPENDLDEAIREKHQAVQRVVEARHSVARVAGMMPRNLAEHVDQSLQYAESLFATMHALIEAMVEYRLSQSDHDPGRRRKVLERMMSAQQAWNHHTQRVTSYPGTATAFRSDNLWQFTERMIDRVS